LFACKQINKQKIQCSSKQITHIINEKEILKKLNNANYYVHISDTFQDENYLYFLLEYLPGGELMKLIR
jgi:protein kinase A